ncbi:MAG: tRNA (guanosine(37)-N1)-methyltransferase TrmD [Candidatus Daviesbacteria bacterium]|nr:tRNA (guanosine(37)-N1)-methyltransferase TrmD [Candidatus Daviesbacteria bacterium]
MKKITVLTLFPQLFEPFLQTSILDRAREKKLVKYNLVDIRKFGEGKHQSVDDRPFGGGAGMILRTDVLTKALKSITKHQTPNTKQRTILMSASGKTFKQGTAQKFSEIDHLIIICGKYEGVDQRFIDKYVDEEISIGDYVLTGGEIPALAVTEATVRLIPGVLKKEDAASNESFSEELEGMLEYPQYTRPETFEGEKVPAILLSGNHAEIEKWQKQQSIIKTKSQRPDLLLSDKNSTP